eukprot:gnl/TRDRNA2_/TRDRNA2_133825_c0_seq1.p1 gnl/TRDRNA2_/TRDRNA2_133825_c0~~gnl/TRDRNA2_/TRDRNA2_133825_c0_seq1.p1  ORF type:complete len:306 (-),score=49.22 gnl/TRDRNA2_/TRDRNA2_133825_c0_seq1:163-1044(-)
MVTGDACEYIQLEEQNADTSSPTHRTRAWNIRYAIVTAGVVIMLCEMSQGPQSLAVTPLLQAELEGKNKSGVESLSSMIRTSKVWQRPAFRARKLDVLQDTWWNRHPIASHMLERIKRLGRLRSGQIDDEKKPAASSTAAVKRVDFSGKWEMVGTEGRPIKTAYKAGSLSYAKFLIAEIVSMANLTGVIETITQDGDVFLIEAQVTGFLANTLGCNKPTARRFTVGAGWTHNFATDGGRYDEYQTWDEGGGLKGEMVRNGNTMQQRRYIEDGQMKIRVEYGDFWGTAVYRRRV